MWKILSPSSCRDSARSLEVWMNSAYPIEHTLKVNWGNSRFIMHNPNEVYGNKMEAIIRSANKNMFFDICKNQGTVPVISSERYVERCYQHIDPSGQNGSGIKFVASEESFTPGVLTVKEIKGDEYRVYFCYDMPKQIYLKAPLTEATPENPIRNSHNGYGYMNNPPQLRKIRDLRHHLYSLTNEVSARMELSYGAIDFILDNDYTIWVLETNSAPTLFNEALVEGFAEEFNRRWGC